MAAMRPANMSLLAALALAFASASLRALPVKDLYEAEVPVERDSPGALVGGAREGLREVLVRVSGRQDIAAFEPIAKALEDPRGFYDQFSYETRSEPPAPGSLPEALPVETTWLKISFEPRALASLLRESGLPVWGANRPAVLLWIASPLAGAADGVEKQLLSADQQGPLLGAFQRQSRRRGLPFLLPLLDLEDSTQITPDHVWDAILARVEAASQRYAPDAILIGRVQSKADGGWWGSWRYELGDGWRRVDNAADTLTELVEAPMNALADSLAARYAIDSTSFVVSMKVDGVKSAAAYAALSRYLESLTPVVKTWLKSLQGDQAEFEIQVEGQQDQLTEIIGLDARMRLLAQDSPTGLHYLWVR